VKKVGFVIALAAALIAPAASHAQIITMYGGSQPAGMCLDDPRASKAPGTALWIFPCIGTPAQKWSPQFLFWAHDDVPVYMWRNQASGLCLNVKHNSWANGTPAIQYYCNPIDPADQIETSHGLFGDTLRHYGTDKCLDNQYNRNTARNPVWWYQCNGAAAQSWNVWL
jgi:hypothetical protein